MSSGMWFVAGMATVAAAWLGWATRRRPELDVAKLQDIIPQLGRVELVVLERVAQRLLIGQEVYGPFRAHDPRNMRQEAHEEALDAAVYLAVLTAGVNDD